MLPGIFPYYVTGAITASGGAWNASIVAEACRGAIQGRGARLGAYIAQTTAAGDYPKIILGHRGDVAVRHAVQPRCCGARCSRTPKRACGSIEPTSSNP